MHRAPKDDLLPAALLALAVTVACLVFVVLMAGCSPRDIPSDAPKPILKSWVTAGGKSMLPVFPERCVVEIEPVGYDALKVGDTVVFWDYTNANPLLIHHRLVAKQGASWIAQGDNRETNTFADRAWVTKDNYLARTTGRWVYLLSAGIAP